MLDLLEVKNVSKAYRAKSGEVKAVDDVDLLARRGEVTVIVGPSGSGKTTLLHLIGSLERPDAGELNVFGENICRPDADLIHYRRRRVGFVFQMFNLVSSLTALENVTLPMDLEGVPAAEQRRRAEELLERMGIENRLQRARANRMSGGEKQRVAIARALANSPQLILADEATGELDSVTAREILALFRRIVEEEHVTMLMASHDALVDEYVDQVLQLRDGQIVTPN